MGKGWAESRSVKWRIRIQVKQASAETLYIGTAGWTVPKVHADAVAAEGSHLERYAGAMDCVEINSTFYRAHQARTFARWAESTPEHFRFAVKMARAVTHAAKLRRCGGALAEFFAQLGPLGGKLGVVLVQLAPKLAFEEGTVREFLETLRELHTGPVVIEPRHGSWFTGEAEQVLREFQVARAMADPPAGSPAASAPGGWAGFRYYRLHGSPRKYWSQYDEEFLKRLSAQIHGKPGRREPGALQTWVVFDNTAQNHAFGDALALRQLLERR